MINLAEYRTKTIILLGSLVFLFLPLEVRSQFLNLRLNVDPELTTHTEQNLNFGTIQTGTGQNAIDFGSTQMGIFSITALENQILLVRIDEPEKLIHRNPAIEDKIPVNLNSRYGYSARNLQNSRPLVQNTQILHVKKNPDPGPWNSIYLYLYGAITINDIAEGVYSSHIVLEVQYI